MDELKTALKNRMRNASPTKVILIGYCCIILLGTVLLCLPFSARQGGTGILDSLFTATSATCVTGLVRFDTYTHWTLFGQLVILFLIQIGGVGFMTFAVSAISFTKAKIGVNQRVMMRDSVSAPGIGGIIRLTRNIIIGTALFEILGAVLLAFHFCPELGLIKGLYFSIFHSVSAFCNAGFDLMGYYAPGTSFTTIGNNLYVNIIIMALIVIGGLGFVVWIDLKRKKFRFRNLTLHSKIVLVTSAVLIVAGTAAVYVFEIGGEAFAGKSEGEKLLLSAFQSVTARTAGFNTVDQASLSGSSQLLTVFLMLVGGSPGSTAGGMKTTAFAVTFLSILTVFRRRKSIECFGRRVEDEALRTASCVMITYIMLSVASALVISAVDSVPVMSALFESSSAIGTVGITLGLTPNLSVVSQLLVTLLMIFGRAGSITILLALGSGRKTNPSKLPVEQVRIG